MKRAVCMVIRLIAAGIIVVSGMNVGLEYVRHRMQGAETEWLRVSLGTFGVVLGIALLFASAPLARRMTDDIDEEE
jgi:uncharacterized membrane protein HdeD (DUF308 family)